MDLRYAILPALLLLAPFQSPANLFREHYKAAEAQHRAGNFPAAEAHYTAILAEAYHELGKVDTAKGDYAAAVTTLEAAAAYQPDSPDVLVDLAIAYFHTEQFPKALAVLGKAVARDPRSAAAHHMLGKTYFMTGDLVKSVAELKTALRLAPGNHDVEYTLALAYLRDHKLPQAKLVFDGLVARLGDRPALRVLIGRGYRETDYLQEGIDEFKKAIALDAHFPRVHYYLGLTYLLKDGAARLAEAEREFRIELAEHPDEFFANYYLGIVSNMNRKWDDAIGFLETACRMQPNNPDPYFHLGQTYQALNRHEQAVEALTKSVALNPDLAHNDYQVATAHYRLGQSLLKLGRGDEGEKELQIAADLKSRSLKTDQSKTEAYLSGEGLRQTVGGEGAITGGEGAVAGGEAENPAAADLARDAEYFAKVIAAAYNSIGLLRAERSDFGAAAEQFALAAKWNPQQEGLNFNLGLASYKAERYKEAVAPLESELAAHPDNLAAKQLLGLSCFMTDDFARAAEVLGEVAAAKPGETALYYPLALSLMKVGKTEEANRIIQQMVASGDNTPQVHILLGQAYSGYGETDKALAELRTALALDPKVRLAHFYTGLMHVKAGKYPEAVTEFEAELALNPKDIVARYHLGYALLAGRDAARGIPTLQEVVKAKPDYADARYELGKALLEKGDVAGAIENLEVAAKLDADAPHVHYQLGRAYIAAGREAEGKSQLDTARQLQAKQRNQSSQ